MTRNNGVAFLSSGCVAIVATVFLYFWLLDDVLTTPIRLTALATLTAAEALATVKAWRIRDAALVQATALVGGVHILLVAATSFVFIALNPARPTVYLLLNAFFLTALAVVDVALFRAARSNLTQNVWNSIVLQAERLRVRYANAACGSKLEALAEAARYSDHTASTGKEAAVASALDALSALLESSADANALEAQISAVAALIEERNVDARASKRGAY